MSDGTQKTHSQPVESDHLRRALLPMMLREDGVKTASELLISKAEATGAKSL